MVKRKRPNNDLQNTTLKTKDWVTRTPLKPGGELGCSRRASSSCSTSGTHHRVILFTNLVISHEWGKAREVLTTSGTSSFMSTTSWTSSFMSTTSGTSSFVSTQVTECLWTRCWYLPKNCFKDKVHVTELYMSGVGCWYIFCIPSLKLNYAPLIPKL
jgi:hypothetical protein